jgi:hypothetical protein
VAKARNEDGDAGAYSQRHAIKHRPKYLDPFRNYCIPSHFVILMAPFLGAGGPMQLCLQSSRGRGLHRSSGLQKTQAIRMTSRWITSKAKK